MPLDYHQLKSTRFDALHHRYGADDCILYALGVGAGLGDPDAFGDEIEYLYEDGIRALPSMVSVIAYQGFWMRDPAHGIDWRKVVHGEQRMTLFGPLPASGSVVSRSCVTRVTDKGERGGAVVAVERCIFDEASERCLARIEQVNVCRGDGGYSVGDSLLSDTPLPPIPSPPERRPDETLRMPTARNQAAIYRLTGDRNPLHIDPESARKAGLDAPILHGASMAGIATRAVLRRPPLGGECFVSQIDIRFTGMAYPGRSVDVECWLGADRTAFRCLEADTHRELAFGHVVWELESATGTGLETEYAEQAD